MATKPRHIDYGKESILIVDDDRYVRETFEQLLSALGFVAASASGGPEALDLLSKARFTFLLTDMRMPDMDGMELIRKVNTEFPDMDIIAMTGYSEGYRYVDVINAGASDFVKKPFEFGELEAKIRRIINERSLRGELERLSITDSLTGLYNQRHFYDRLKEEIIRSARQKHPLSLILLDLDNFKEYNDTHGHLAGDEVLRNVGIVVNKSIRVGVDSGYRYGGDEFAIILIDADQGAVREIRRRIKDSLWDGVKIGVSMGSAVLHEGMSAQELIKGADEHLYTEKTSQRATRR